MPFIKKRKTDILFHQHLQDDWINKKNLYKGLSIGKHSNEPLMHKATGHTIVALSLVAYRTHTYISFTNCNIPCKLESCNKEENAGNYTGAGTMSTIYDS